MPAVKNRAGDDPAQRPEVPVETQPCEVFFLARLGAGTKRLELELARSAVMLAHGAIDDDAVDAAIARAASLAKAKLSEVAMLVGHEAIQMHGGIGMTDEHDIGLFVKRARVAEITFGDAAHHRDRLARLDGY